jgi:hypothetical protein
MTPLPLTLLPIWDIDLNCDGRLELIRVIPTPDHTDNANIFGVLVSEMQANGFYRDRWQYTIADVAALAFSWPELIPVGTCETILSFKVFGGEQVEVRLFRWNGETMTPFSSEEGK